MDPSEVEARSIPPPAPEDMEALKIPPPEQLGYKPKAAKDALEPFVSHMANQAMGGYLPQIDAARKTVGASVQDLVTGSNQIAGDPAGYYVKQRDASIADLKANPNTAGDVAGTVMGGMLASKITPAIEGASALSRIAQAGGIAGAYGAALNPGDVPGEIHPFQPVERLTNAALAAPLGATFQAAGEGLSSLSSNLSQKAQETAYEKAIQAAGAFKKDFNLAINKDQLESLGEVLLNPLPQTGETPVNYISTVKSIADKVEEAQEITGKEIGSTLDNIPDGAQVHIDGRQIALGLSQDEDIQRLKYIPGSEGTSKTVNRYLNTLARSSDMDLREAQAIRQGIDRNINWENKKIRAGDYSDLSAAQPFLYKIRDQISNTMNDAVNALDEMSGGVATDRLKKANLAYSKLTTLADMSNNRLASLNANRMIGLTDTIAGGAGGTIGATIGSATGIPGAGKAGAAIGTLSGAALNKAGRTYGPAFMGSSLHNLIAPGLAEAPQIMNTVNESLPGIPAMAIANSVVQKKKDSMQRRLNNQ